VERFKERKLSGQGPVQGHGGEGLDAVYIIATAVSSWLNRKFQDISL
jgi:hypothetical protein